MATRALLLALLLASGLLAQDAYRASGSITQNGHTLEVQSAIAVWDDQEKALVIGLFPFAVADDEVRQMVSGSAQEVAAGKPSPNPALWEKTPLGGIVIRYKKRPKQFTIDKLTGFSLRANWMEHPERSLGVGRRNATQFTEEISLLEGDLDRKTGGSVRMVCKGSEAFSVGYLDWDLDIECLVHIKGERALASK